MSLTSTPHLVAAVVCVAAAGVMLVRAQGRTTRAAHAVVLACMVVLVFGMGSLYVVLGCAIVLAMTATMLIIRSRERAAHACAVDVAAGSGLVLLMSVPLLMAGHATAPSPGSTGVHAGLHSTIPGGADHRVLLVAAALLLVVCWALARRRVSPTSPHRSAGAAAWLMMAAMGMMLAA